ncbi:Succinylglutamate desuccinylase / Aspartoacylase family protein [Muriicola jejuensis]|uniref:Aspartoacylase n=1 Tax=Muriicola jejuensis TaxID=504488 RepID=A0A6P0U9P5_9FLAO|nr:succinylglutamate desuccinylase/aspartoacylase family protein [Muriicola jejuensis]NER09955.1 aspartoacylase [Muriicola jejuensis]SMP04436.1 Succinylglutamate desuccinylase / Aspartoacylase family protein [Muriicola jejuensis]
MPTARTAIDTHLKRILGHIKGREPGPVLVFFGGIHGNEPSGIQALEKVFDDLSRNPLSIKGHIYGIAGNIPAILQNRRYLEKDLNRTWFREDIAALERGEQTPITSEDRQMLEILGVIRDLLKAHEAPFYFIDFHTTSSKTLPFITINDAMINRKFARNFPVPIILGIEEYLEGPVLNYINEFGYVSLGFESGQHASEEARVNNIAFFWLSLVFTGALQEEEVEDFNTYFAELKQSAANNRNFYEITERYAIESGDTYEMIPGFSSFETVKKGNLLATHNEKQVVAEKKGILFMPLYQQQGAEGYFMIRRIPKWVLALSGALRKFRAEHLLASLPGVSWKDREKSQLIVNLRVARFYSKAIFHLLGFRNRTLDQNHLLIKNRERAARNELYEEAPWY